MSLVEERGTPPEDGELRCDQLLRLCSGSLDMTWCKYLECRRLTCTLMLQQVVSLYK